MMSFDEGEDNFFDAYEEIRSSIDSLSSDNSLAAAHRELELLALGYELWLREPMSVQDRRQRFLMGMGFDEFAATSCGCSMSAIVSAEEQPDRERIMQNSGAVLDSLASSDGGQSEDSFCYIRDLDNGRKFVVHELGKDGLPCMFKEVGSDKLITLQDFEILLGLSQSVQKFLRREVASYRENTTRSGDAKKNKILNWCRSFSKTRQCARASKYDVSSKKSKITRMIKTKVHQYRKNCSEFTALYMTQEIQAHKGMIRAMKFCPTGRYLASGGEDCVLRIWQIIQMDSSCRCTTSKGSSRLVSKTKAANLVPGKGSNFAPVLIPKKICKIEENPLQELSGHTSDILDISWSNFNCLLTSSKDKTVRLWKVGCPGCLKIFRHNDYVTCIQFNPIDDRFFISGSIDGKVRVWEIPENRVIDWVDVRNMVTAICYQPDGKGFVVGSIKGNCRFYDCSAARMCQLASELSLFGKKKSSGKRITGLQFCPGDSKRVMITSADSRIRISDGVDIILKFKGLRKAKCQLCASFTADGRHIISMGEDSNVYLWSYDKSGDVRCGGGGGGGRSVRSSEFFFSKAATIVAPWPGRINQGALASDSIQISSQPRSREPVSWLMNPDCFSLGMRLFSDGSSRMTATWPEEKLSLHTTQQLQPEDRSNEQHNSPLHRDFWSLALTAGAWSSVVVTAGNDGIIRSFHNYGFPVRL